MIAAPWSLHLALSTGQPLFNLSSYMLIGYWARPELSPLRDFMLTPDRWPGVLRETLPALPAKWAELFPHAMKRALMAPTGATGWLAALGVVLAVLRGRAGIAALAIPLAAIPVLVQTLTLYDSRYLVPFLPLWTLAVAWAAAQLASRVAWLARPRAWMLALALLVMPSALPALREEAARAAKLRDLLARERLALASAAVTRETRAQAGPSSGRAGLRLLGHAADRGVAGARRARAASRARRAQPRGSPGSWRARGYLVRGREFAALSPPASDRLTVRFISTRPGVPSVRSSFLAAIVLAACLAASNLPAAPLRPPQKDFGARMPRPEIEAAHASDVESFCGTPRSSAAEMVARHLARGPLEPNATTWSTDVGEIAVMEDDGTFFFDILNDGSRRVLDVAAASRAFYRTHGDD